MEKIKEKLHVPKGNNPRSPDVRRLSAILRDSMYLAWPAASFSEDNSSEAKKRLFRQSATMVGDDEDEDYDYQPITENKLQSIVHSSTTGRGDVPLRLRLHGPDRSLQERV